MAKMKNFRKSFSGDSTSLLEDVMEFIDSSLTSIGTNKKLIQKTELITEEMIAELSKNSFPGSALKVQVTKRLGDTSVNLSMKGAAFEPYSDDESIDEDSSIGVIRSVLLRSYGENFKYRNKNNVNLVRIVADQSEQKLNNSALYALALGLVFGIIARMFIPQPVNAVLCDYILDPIKTVFMHAIKIIVAPVVFFSIVSCFSQFGSLSEVGKLGSKVIGVYLLTTVIAVFVGLAVFSIIQPGEFGFALASDLSSQAVNIDTSVDTSLLSTVLNIVPSNFLSPFLESDTLQLIFLAVLCGLSVGSIGQYSAMLKELFDALNSLFLSITKIIAKFIPVAGFVSIALLIINLSIDNLVAILSAALSHMLAICVMLCVYGMLVMILGRVNPIKFFKNNREGMITSLTLSSSSASVPTNMRVCTEKMGISPVVANFSIPLGATINMDGVCIYLTMFGLFMAKAYGIQITLPALISLCFTIVLLSLGAPGVPGCALICLGVILETLNIPMEALGLIIAINPILDMFDTMSNTTGDVAAAVIVARSEKMLDVEKFNS
ncbi:dicarboxylate/amino acid:cation symporter [Butyrivibrio sp. CB08]|uniref:dicarboxylate/amino acid:cation symporter n=1 Tax=Butyrivibrio sp. CB08 TaxID=2364879 RepID=UPI0013148209|nr:dicarboxylate/amino acid:cation symporter [Butyrivibrio sp. CB08]